MMETGISTITFYKGDFKPAAAAVRAQLARVVASNAWLSGRLVKTKEGVRLRHPASPSAADIDALFAHFDPDGSGALDYKELQAALRSHAPSSKVYDSSLQAAMAAAAESGWTTLART